jgi:hypothetical protein
MWPFSRKKPGPETTPGGSRIIRYGGQEFDKPQFGVSAENQIEFAQQRAALYEELFGKGGGTVWHEMLPLVPHIDVYTHEPNHGGRDFFTLVTSGMSDFRMSLPAGAGVQYARAELILYTSTPKREYLELLRRLAHFPHDNHTWLGPGHTMPNGQPPELMFGSKVLDALFFIPTIVHPDKEIGKRLRLDGDPVSFLWVVPITSRECDLKLNQGTGALLDLFEREKHPFVFNGDRDGYV